MAWRRQGDKPLSEPMMDNVPAHIYMSLCLDELSKVTAAHLKIGHPQLKYSNEMQRLDWLIVYQESSSCNAHQGDMPY